MNGKENTTYVVKVTQQFKDWLAEQPLAIQKRIAQSIILLQEYGYNLSRPHADTLYGSKFGNMKELRIQIKGDPYRAFYAFDPISQAIILCASNKGGNEKQFYKQMIPLADKLYQQYLDELENDNETD